MSMQQLNQNKVFKWTNIIIFSILFFFLISVDIQTMAQGKAWKENSWVKHVLNPYIWAALTTYIVFVPGIYHFRVYKLLLQKKLHMDILIAAAIHIAYLFSIITVLVNKNLMPIWEPIGLLYVFETVSKEVENHIKNKNDRERQKLESLQVETVTLLNGQKVKINSVKKGQVVVFPKDAIIQLDGVIYKGEGMIDVSNINGESKPYYAKTSSNVVSGSKVLNDKIFVKVSHTFENSTLNRLILLINKTGQMKPRIQTLADKIAKYLLPSALFITLFTWITWMTLGLTTNITPAISSENFVYNAFLIAVAVLAMICPCAMTMTAPLINLVAAQSYWKANVIFNKVDDMEKILFVDKVVLDKTGTLTTNQMVIKQTFGGKKYHKIAAALEKNVYHPIANAIYQAYPQTLKITEINNQNGQGITGVYNHKKYFIGKTTQADIANHFHQKVLPGTYVGLYENQKLVASYVLEAKLKPHALKLINFFKKKGIDAIILSGDNEKATQEIATKLKIAYKANQSPTAKAEYIQSLQKAGHKVMMVGDGLNDSIAIKTADVSLTFASGSSISNSYSSISLLSDDLQNIVYLMQMGQKTRANYIVAIAWAIGFNLLFIPFAAMGLILPWIAAIIMYVSNVILFIIILSFWLQLNVLELKVFGKKITKRITTKTKLVTKTMTHTCH